MAEETAGAARAVRKDVMRSGVGARWRAIGDHGFRGLKRFPFARTEDAATVSAPSLPGLAPQVGFTRLAARRNAGLGQARVPVQSIFFAKRVLRSGWTRGSSPRVTPENG